MNRITFEIQPEAPVSAPNRADICCFVGFVKKRGGTIPAEVRTWLKSRGWISDDGAAAVLPDGAPVPVTNWNTFDQIFAWDERGGPNDGTTYMGAAVRSYFAQGGRKCYVMRADDPLGPLAKKVDRVAQISK